LRRSLRNRLLAVALSLTAVVLLAELGARLVVGVPWAEREPLLVVRANRGRGWEMVPGVHYTYDRLVNVNQLGLRGPELAERQPGERRVLILGDSFVYGQGAGEDETIPAELERALAARCDHPVTAVNGGHRAYSTHQELALLRELGPRIQPDDVLVLYFWNDSIEHDLKAQAARLRRKGPLAFDVGEPMEGWPRASWHAVQLARRSALVMWLYDVVRGADRAGRKPFSADTYRPHFAKQLAKFQGHAKKLGSRLHFAIIPDPHGMAGPHPSDEIEAVVLEVLADAGLQAIDLEGPLTEWIGAGPVPVIPYDGHYLASANRVMAEALANALLE